MFSKRNFLFSNREPVKQWAENFLQTNTWEEIDRTVTTICGAKSCYGFNVSEFKKLVTRVFEPEEIVKLFHRELKMKTTQEIKQFDAIVAAKLREERAKRQARANRANRALPQNQSTEEMLEDITVSNRKRRKRNDGT